MRQLILIPLCAVACTGTAVSSEPGQVPVVHASTLSGAAVDLPAGLHGKAGVLVLGFSQGARDEVTAWGRRLAQEYRDSHRVEYYEMAELQSIPRPLRAWVARRIAASVPARAQSHFVQLEDHEAEWKRVCGLTTQDQVGADKACVLLIDGSGVVHYRSSGATSDAAFAQLKLQIESVLPG